MTNAEARFNNSLRPRKPEGSLGRTAQDVHLDSHTAPELYVAYEFQILHFYGAFSDDIMAVKGLMQGRPGRLFLSSRWFRQTCS